MSATENKTAIGEVFEHLARGDGRPFIDLMADDFTWIFKGSMNWRGRYSGKDGVRTKLLAPLFANFAGGTSHVRILARHGLVGARRKLGVQQK